MTESSDKKDDMIRNYLSKALNKQNQLRKNLKKKFKVQKKSTYGKSWQEKNYEWYSVLLNGRPLLHQDFINYLHTKKDIKTVLEVGCGAGTYPIKFKELFTNMQYTGIDISKSAIEYCKQNSNFNFICGDIIKMEMKEKYDLVFSHAVIDHVYDIDAFLSKITQASKKYAYISAYRGYFPTLKKHKMNWNNEEGVYYNDLSAIQVKKLFLQNDLKENEFIIMPQESGQKNLEIETIIKLEKKN